MTPASVRDEPVESLEALARVAARDDEAFERLVRRCWDRVHRWALVATGSPDDPDDVAQEALLRAHRGLASFRGDARFTTWLYRVVRSTALDHARSRSSRRDMRERLGRELTARGTDHDDGGEPVERVERERRVALVRAFWAELPPVQRQLFDLCDLQGHAPKEAAEMLEMHPVTARANLFKARRTIRERFMAAEGPT